MIKYRWKEGFTGYWYQQNPADVYLDAQSKERLRWVLESGEEPDDDSEAEAYYLFGIGNK